MQTTLRLLSYNIQVGIDSHGYGHYVTRSWRHLLPSRKRQDNLFGVSNIVQEYDLVALQEADGGSLRSGFINQVRYLGEIGHFCDWYQQCNRNLGRLAQQSNGLLSRIPIHSLTNHRLPGLIPGRGAIEAILGEGEVYLAVIVVHLSLGRHSRKQQLDYLADRAAQHQYVAIMGDLNISREALVDWAGRHHLQIAGDKQGQGTYPSWQPRTHLDHILISESLTICEAKVLPFRFSDHLPITAIVELPQALASALALDSGCADTSEIAADG